MPGAGKRGLAVMDEWFDRDPRPNVPEKSLGSPKVGAAIVHADNLYIDYLRLNAPVHTWPVD